MAGMTWVAHVVRLFVDGVPAELRVLFVELVERLPKGAHQVVDLLERLSDASEVGADHLASRRTATGCGTRRSEPHARRRDLTDQRQNPHTISPVMTKLAASRVADRSIAGGLLMAARTRAFAFPCFGYFYFPYGEGG